MVKRKDAPANFKKMTRFLPYSRQTIEKDDLVAVSKILQSDFLTTGPEVAHFEKQLQEYMQTLKQTPEVVVVNSGTAALDFAWRSINAKAGDKVIVPALTFLSAASTALICGYEVIFADCDPDTGLMNVDTIMQAAGNDQNIKAICVVHLNGQFAPMPEIRAFANEKKWQIIEDACHILGGHIFAPTYQPMQKPTSPAGNCHFSDFTVFSLHAVKNITTGEGGIVTCKDKKQAEKMRSWRSHGIVRDANLYQMPQNSSQPWYHEMQDLGSNYRMSDFAAALGRSQLAKLPRFIAERAQIYQYYQENLQNFAPKIRLLQQMNTGIPAWHLCVALIDFQALPISRASLMQKLRIDNIGTQVHYIPLYRQPFFAKKYPKIGLENNFANQFKGAEKYYASALSLPLFPGLMKTDVARICAKLVEHLGLKNA